MDQRRLDLELPAADVVLEQGIEIGAEDPPEAVNVGTRSPDERQHVLEALLPEEIDPGVAPAVGLFFLFVFLCVL